MSDETLAEIEDIDVPSTYFASAARASREHLGAAAAAAERDGTVSALLSAIEGLAVMLNSARQIVAANDGFLEAARRGSLDGLLGARPGEAMGCVHATEGPGGCGTSFACADCGAVAAVLASIALEGPAERECLITAHSPDGLESLEFRVRATPLKVGDHDLTVVVLQDVSSQKRREALEAVFLHDLMNTINGISGWSTLLPHLDADRARNAAGRITHLCKHLAHEVNEQRALLDAEQGRLAVRSIQTTPSSVLDDVQAVLRGHPLASERDLVVLSSESDEPIETDPTLLVRVLVNMAKNALEATAPGEPVRLSYERRPGAPTFSVWNPGVIEARVQRHLFQRSFSTKGTPGRGLGTYSMKLLGERYLDGHVDFESTGAGGTWFRIALPVRPTTLP